MLKYENISPGIFHNRPNRFIAEVEINGRLEQCHVKNTGRCKELLIPGVKVYVSRSDNPNRVTKYDLIAVEKGDRLVNIDSQAPNKVFMAYLKSGGYIDGITYIKPEATHEDSRYDFYVEAGERKIYIEMKGVTLEKDGIALFPDAPTERGVKHLQGLVRCVRNGCEAHVVFVVKMRGIQHFSPNCDIHPAFGAALVEAARAGVHVKALGCEVAPDSLVIDREIPVILPDCPLLRFPPGFERFCQKQKNQNPRED